MIHFGPGGLGGVKEAISNLEEYHKLGLSACEIEFVRQIYIRNEKDAEAIKLAAEKLGIALSIHAPYYTNLNSADKKIIEDTKKRILDCCAIGEKLGAYCVVFHAGYYGEMGEEETYENIKKQINEMMGEIKKKGWKIKLAPETMGKINVFGSIEQIARLCSETGCFACIDFAHILARYKSVDYDKIKKLFGHFEKWHCHFSGIEYGEKGEKNHIKTTKENWKKLISELPKNKEIVIINESPFPVEDSLEGLKIYEKN